MEKIDKISFFNENFLLVENFLSSEIDVVEKRP